MTPSGGRSRSKGVAKLDSDANQALTDVLEQALDSQLSDLNAASKLGVTKHPPKNFNQEPRPGKVWFPNKPGQTGEALWFALGACLALFSILVMACESLLAYCQKAMTKDAHRRNPHWEIDETPDMEEPGSYQHTRQQKNYKYKLKQLIFHILDM